MTETTGIQLMKKYEPKTLSEVKGRKPIISPILKMIKSEKMIPHLLFTGKGGLGKTLIARLIAREIFGEDISGLYFEFNSSKDRGIDVIREQLKEIIDFKPLEATHKIICMDEADGLTPDAQKALRPIMIDYQDHVRFIFTANNPNKIIQPIKDRCTAFSFEPYDDKFFKKLLKRTAKKEGVKLSKETRKVIIHKSAGSVRQLMSNLLLVKSGLKPLNLENPFTLSFDQMKQATFDDPEGFFWIVYSHVINKKSNQTIEIIDLFNKANYEMGISLVPSIALQSLWMNLKKLGLDK